MSTECKRIGGCLKKRFGDDIDCKCSSHRKTMAVESSNSLQDRLCVALTAEQRMKEDLAVAEKIRKACFAIADYGDGGREGVMKSIRELDLMAVITKKVD